MGWLADETGLEKCAANYTPLSPLSFLKRAADIHAGVASGELLLSPRLSISRWLIDSWLAGQPGA